MARARSVPESLTHDGTLDNASAERRSLLLWGAGGHGKVVADVARAAGWTLAGYVDAEPAKRGHVVEPGGARVIYDETELFAALATADRPFGAVAVALGDNALRLKAWQRLRDRAVLPALVHPSAVISPSAVLGEATVVMPLAVVNAGVRIGAAAIVNTGAIVEHDCQVGNAVHLSPRSTLAGGVSVEDLAWIGAGATVIQNLRVGAASRVGAGAVVIRDVAGGVTVVGCPARAR